jgi:hypothetical protein
LYGLWIKEVVCAEGDARFEVGGEISFEYGSDLGEILDDDLEVREFGRKDGVVVAG